MGGVGGHALGYSFWRLGIVVSERIWNLVKGLALATICSGILWLIVRPNIYEPWVLSKDGIETTGVVKMSFSTSYVSRGGAHRNYMHVIEYDGHTFSASLRELHSKGSQVPVMYSAEHPEIAVAYPAGRTFKEHAFAGVSAMTWVGTVLVFLLLCTGYVGAGNLIYSALRKR